MIGTIVNSCAVVAGSALGAGLGRHLPERVKKSLPLIVGVVVISLGSALVVKAAYLPVIVISMVIGTTIGELAWAEKGLETLIRKVMQWSHKHGKTLDDAYIIDYITLVSAWCFGSMGFFGAMREGITGDPIILYTKAALDFFCATVFASNMGIRLAFIALPQFIFLVFLYFVAQFIMPVISPEMLNDFSGCGGVVFLATGLRMCGIKIFPLINMMPSLAVVFPISWLWAHIVG